MRALSSCTFLALCGALAAQDLQQPFSLPDRVPIHAAPGATGGERWAAGRAYRARFDDGMTVFATPEPGAEAALLRWDTESIRVGQRVIVDRDTARAERHGDWRVERAVGPVVEAYDVLAKGVEQTFVLRQPLGQGDVVVRGRITSSLSGPAPVRAHGALEFSDRQGRAVLRYGAAVAVDRSGRELPLATGWDGTHVTLTVPDSWLRDASYPVTIDPVTQPAFFATEVSSLAIARDEEAGQLLVVAVSIYTGVVAYLCNDDFSSPTIVFADMTGFGRMGAATFVGGADRWVVAYYIQVGSSVSLRVYLHDQRSVALNSGPMLSVHTQTAIPIHPPAIGGRAGYTTGDQALLAYELNNDVEGVLVDARQGVLGTPFPLAAPGTVLARQWPAVNQTAGTATEPWVAVWQERASNLVKWEVHGSLIAPDGTRLATARIGPESSTSLQSPRVDGRAGRYLAVYERMQRGVEARRFDWDPGSVTPLLLPPRSIYQTAGNVIWGVSFDPVTASHWGVLWDNGTSQDLLTTRVGACGCPVESVTTLVQGTPLSGADAAALTFDRDAGHWPMVYSQGGKGYVGSTYALELQHPSTARATPYGIGCGGAIAAAPPYAGSDPWPVTLSNAPPATAAALLVSGQAAELNLAFAGMPGCFLAVGPAASIPTATGSVGTASLSLALPDCPAPFRGDVYLQWAFVAPGSNALGVATTQGLRAEIR